MFCTTRPHTSHTSHISHIHTVAHAYTNTHTRTRTSHIHITHTYTLLMLSAKFKSKRKAAITRNKVRENIRFVSARLTPLHSQQNKKRPHQNGTQMVCMVYLCVCVRVWMCYGVCVCGDNVFKNSFSQFHIWGFANLLCRWHLIVHATYTRAHPNMHIYRYALKGNVNAATAEHNNAIGMDALCSHWLCALCVCVCMCMCIYVCVCVCVFVSVCSDPHDGIFGRKSILVTANIAQYVCQIPTMVHMQIWLKGVVALCGAIHWRNTCSGVFVSRS